MDLKSGLLFANRYVLERLLGKGGFSEVWLATDKLTNIRVAVKVFATAQGGLDDEGVVLFSQEFAMVFDMNQTNLLHPTHYDCWERMPYLILPYCQNGSALKYISGNVRLSEDEAWRMLRDVASGLAYLHSKNPPVIHQDIKPDNILISDEGHYMITDFGISTKVRSTMRKNNSGNNAGGTLAYMGPERYGKSPLPIMASDIWSLGAMMFEALMGWLPFGENGGAHQKNGAEIPVIEGNYSDDLKQLIYSCLALEPWDRPTARDIEDIARTKTDNLIKSLSPFDSMNKRPGGSLKPKSRPKYITEITGHIRNIPNLIKDIFNKIKSQKKILYGLIGAVIIAAAITVISLASEGDKSENNVVILSKPEYADSLYRADLDIIIRNKYTADTTMLRSNNIDLKVDSLYLKLYDELHQILTHQDGISPEFFKEVSSYEIAVKDSLTKTRSKLMEIFDSYDDESCRVRADKINMILDSIK